MTATRLHVERLVGQGRGLAHRQGEVWMVEGALPDEEVLASPIRRRAGVIEAVAVELLGDAHPARAAAPCPHAPICGGCDWPHVEPVAGAELKAAVAAGAARGHRELANRLAAAAVRQSPLAHRLRVRLHWSPESSTLGFFARRSRRATPIPACRIVSPRLAAALPELAAILPRHAPPRLELEWLEDLAGDRAVVGLGRARRGPPRLDPSWLPTESEAAGVIDGCHLLLPHGKLGHGWGASSVQIGLEIALEAPIGVFFQANRHLVPWLFGRVAELAEATPTPVWDLHAGVGFLAAATRSAAERELDLAEISVRAAEAARRNLPGARVAVGVSAERALDRAGRLDRDVLVVTDPPRAGLSRELRRRLVAWRPARILTLGCDPATWARDAAFLLEHGYRLPSLELADLFPSTHHVEVVAMLEAR